ncbi:hypothetical protein DE146DRAFT_14966 [Phaeosphaeria sp. MPI-PUGE-AT-0046c]|nr:hypothetical protein DE146DRAFT_14966 [Phaeosphaeria sp. MPI-PUGE-AT-0046c]
MLCPINRNKNGNDLCLVQLVLLLLTAFTSGQSCCSRAPGTSPNKTARAQLPRSPLFARSTKLKVLHQNLTRSEVVPLAFPSPVFQLRLGRPTVRFERGYGRDLLAIVGSTNHCAHRSSRRPRHLARASASDAHCYRRTRHTLL